MVMPQFLQSVKWAGIPSSLGGGSKQDTGKHRQTQHSTAGVKHGPPLRTERSLEHTEPDPGPCSLSSADQGEAKGSCHSRDILHFSSQSSSEVHCSHLSPCLALCWRVDCIRDFPGNLLFSRLAAPSPHPLQPTSPGAVRRSFVLQGKVCSCCQFNSLFPLHQSP